MDKIIIKGVRFYGWCGVSEEERKLGGRYSVDVEMACDLTLPGRSDDLADTIDYSEVYKLVREIGEKESFHLIEALAGRMAGAILEHFPVEEVVLRVKKLTPPMAGLFDYVGVEIRRTKGKPSEF